VNRRANSTQLSEADLLSHAGEAVFARGEDYVRYVHGMRVRGRHAQGTIQARNVYQVELDWSYPDLASSCTCPHFDQGFFCKHLVALGLAVIDAQVAPGTSAPPEGGVDSYLEGLDARALRALVRELVSRDRKAERLVEFRAAASGADSDDVAKDLVATVNEALRARGFVDYGRSFDVAKDAEELLDELESFLDAGAADAVRPALLRALTRLRRITETADDSSGVLGAACQRAANLHARSCREGKPEGRRLARWLAKFRDESPGWPIVTLSHYAPAFDERSLTVYRKAVAGLDEKYATTDRWKRFEVDRMRLELADHDGDVDRAIEILTAGEHPSFGAVIDRLRGAGRDSEVVDWMDRAVAADHVSGQMGGQGHDYWLDPADVAEVYLAAERSGDAIAVLRRAFSRRPNASTFSELVSYAARLDRRDEEREWAIAESRRLAATPHSNGAVLVDIALSEGDLEAAWAASDEFGPGHMWKQLASVSSEARPRAAADLYRREVERNLVQANTKVYAQIAEDLRTMRDLMSKAGDEADFAAFVSEIRETYRRRPSLMAALDRKGL
jgi:uncharacterized Zn finger protein